MGKLGRVIALLGCALACACSSSEQRATSGADAPRKELTRVTLKPHVTAPADPRFDAQGRLKGSGQHASWLELPMGVREQPGSTPQAAIYQGDDLPFVKVRDYLDERLAPRELQVTETNVGFRAAKPTHTQLAMGTLDVKLLLIDAATNTVRILVDDLSPNGAPPLSAEAAKQELLRARQRVE